MKQNFILNFFLITFIALASIFCSPVLTSAANPVDVQGTAEVVSTGGLFLFDENNSNVTVDPATGDMTGFVWSEELGWIDFDNNGGTGSAVISLSNGKVSGLAYVANTGGHIDFTNFNSNTVVNLSSGAISGFAWSEDLGWIDFSSVQLSGSLLPSTETGDDVSLTRTGQNIFPIIIGATLLFGFSLFALIRLRKKLIRAD